jgi:Patatin-like phospholipase
MPRRLFLYLYMLRAPFLILVLLGILLPAAFGSPMLHGLADLEPNQIIPVSLGAFLLLSAAMTCAFLVLLYGSARADGRREPVAAAAAAVALPQRLPLSGWIIGGLYLLGTSFYLRFLSVVCQTMKSAHQDPTGLSGFFWWRALLGTLFGAALVVVVFLLDLWISDPREVPEIEVFALPLVYLLRGWNWLTVILRTLSKSCPARVLGLSAAVSRSDRLSLLWVRLAGPGYGKFDQHGNPTEINPGHVFAGMLFAVCFALYFIAGFGGHRQLYSDAAFSPPRPVDAVLLQVLLLLLLGCWALSALNFYFDRFRIPVLVPIAFFLVAMSRFGPSDHAFNTIPQATNAQASLPAPDKRFAAAPDHLIVVTAAGGGIQSAAWTSQVLCGLRREIGPSFDQSVLAISGVSGGSVGTMFYLRCRESPPRDMRSADAATNSSLEAIAWGLAHPDLRRAVLPVEGWWWPGDDRGWALERALRKNAQFSPLDRPLGSPDAASKWPVVLLNTTEARTGDPLVFTNSNFPAPSPSRDVNHSLHGFHLVYAGRDVRLETAVRLSAAFPFVSPAARADIPGDAEHLVDGGYFDNSGLFTLTEWLKDAALPTQDANGKPDSQHPPKKILILRIDAFPDRQWHGPQDKPHRWPYQVAAPLDAILSVRSEGQLVRDGTEGADLIEILTRRGYEAISLTARYDPSDVPPSATGLNCPEAPPLTWHLTQVEKLCILQNWNAKKNELLLQVRNFLASPVNPPVKAPPLEEVKIEPVKKGVYIEKMAKP